jgi:hypothetical protein
VVVVTLVSIRWLEAAGSDDAREDETATDKRVEMPETRIDKRENAMRYYKCV